MRKMGVRKPLVVRKNQKHDVYVGRPSKWGNPFIIGTDGTRSQVIIKYEKYLRENKRLMDSLIELRGKILACWCAPLPCHADILVKLANCKNCLGEGTVRKKEWPYVEQCRCRLNPI